MEGITLSSAPVSPGANRIPNELAGVSGDESCVRIHACGEVDRIARAGEPRYRVRRGDEDETSAPGNEPTTDETPESVLAAKEIGAVVNAAMAALPEDLRQAITLREIEGLSYDEIAAVMNCPIGTVRSRIFRAREAISTRIRPMLEHQAGRRW